METGQDESADTGQTLPLINILNCSLHITAKSLIRSVLINARRRHRYLIMERQRNQDLSGFLSVRYVQSGRLRIISHVQFMMEKVD